MMIIIKQNLTLKNNNLNKKDFKDFEKEKNYAKLNKR